MLRAKDDLAMGRRRLTLPGAADVLEREGLDVDPEPAGHGMAEHGQERLASGSRVGEVVGVPEDRTVLSPDRPRREGGLRARRLAEVHEAAAPAESTER